MIFLVILVQVLIFSTMRGYLRAGGMDISSNSMVAATILHTLAQGVIATYATYLAYKHMRRQSQLHTDELEDTINHFNEKEQRQSVCQYGEVSK